MASAVYILDLQGKVIISRDYRGDTIAPLVQEHFVQRVIAPPSSSTSSTMDHMNTTTNNTTTNTNNNMDDIPSSADVPPPPVFESGGMSFAHILHKDIYRQYIPTALVIIIIITTTHTYNNSNTHHITTSHTYIHTCSGGSC